MSVPVSYANYGNTEAEEVVISVTLDEELTYLADSADVEPTMDGNTLSWAMPNLTLLEKETFYLYLALPEDAEYGTLYPIEATFASAGPESDTSNNSVGEDVMAARQLHLPVIARWAWVVCHNRFSGVRLSKEAGPLLLLVASVRVPLFSALVQGGINKPTVR